MNAMLANEFFTRTKENKLFHTQMNMKNDLQGDRVFFRETPTSNAVNSYAQQEDI